MEPTPLSPHDEMVCRELVEVVTDYLEGTLPADDRQRLEAHLEECPYCMSYIEQLRETVAALGGLNAEQLSPQARRELLEAFRGWRDK
jgi:anti-sigma factor RsiW